MKTWRAAFVLEIVFEWEEAGAVDPDGHAEIVEAAADLAGEMAVRVKRRFDAEVRNGEVPYGLRLRSAAVTDSDVGTV